MGPGQLQLTPPHYPQNGEYNFLVYAKDIGGGLIFYAWEMGEDKLVYGKRRGWGYEIKIYIWMRGKARGFSYFLNTVFYRLYAAPQK